jgi:hypothetical protein
MVVVPLVTIGLAIVAVSVAWRSSKTNQEASASSTTPATQEVSADVFLGCTNCHTNLDKVFQTGRSDLLYRHKTHFATGVSECSACHPADTHEPDKINRPKMTNCFICHGQSRTAIAPGTCITCHPAGSPRQPASHLDATWVTKEHSKQALADRFQCLTCHTEQTCQACHGVQLPHPEQWAQTLHAQTYFEDPSVCEKCHQVAGTAPPGANLPPRSLCDSCHHPQGPKETTWIQYHRKVVFREGAIACFQCHATDTCATCHRTGQLDLTADEQHFLENQSGSASPAP